MTDPTLTSATTPPTINPLWITLGLPLLRQILIATGAATAATADTQAHAILPELATVAVAAWGLVSWYLQRQKALHLNKLPAGSAVVK